MPASYRIDVRDTDNLTVLGAVADLVSLKVVLKFNDLGTWELVTAADSAAAALLTPGRGVLIRRNGLTLISGPLTASEVRYDPRTNQLTASGTDDLQWIADRLALPNTNEPPVQGGPQNGGGTYNVISGLTSTVLLAFVNLNAGPGALGFRQVPGLTIGADPLLGVETSYPTRYDKILPVLKSLALTGGDLGFRVAQTSTGLEFQVYESVDRSGTVVFSANLDNIRTLDSKDERSTANYIYGGDSGTGAGQFFYATSDPTSIARWGIVEDYVSATNTSDPLVVEQEVTAELQRGQELQTVTLTPLDSAQSQFGRDYGIGDQISVIVGGVPSVLTVRQVDISLDASGEVIQPQISTPLIGTLVKSLQTLRSLDSRVGMLERTR